MRIKDKRKKKPDKELEKDDDEIEDEDQVYIKIGNIELESNKKNLPSCKNFIGEVIEDKRIRKYLDIDKINDSLTKLNAFNFYG